MKPFLIFIVSIVTLSCNRTDCSKIPSTFKSLHEAESFVSGASFTYTDRANTSKSSWISGANYYSCDSQLGFLILETNKSNYIYQNVPIDIWIGFKSAQSFGSYYNRFIKHQYPLKLVD